MKTLEDVLAHHGVLGMRWGFRKPGTGTPSSHKAPHSEDAKRAASSQARVKAAKGTHVLSNDDLQHLVNRLNLEKQYSTLTNSNSGKNPWAKALMDIGQNVARKQLQSALNDVAAKQVRTTLKKKGLT